MGGGGGGGVSGRGRVGLGWAEAPFATEQLKT